MATENPIEDFDREFLEECWKLISDFIGVLWKLVRALTVIYK